MNKIYYVKLTNKQRQHLEKLISSGIAPARTITRAHILLKSDCSPEGPNWTYARTSEAFNVTDATISKICKRFVESGFEAALYHKKPDREYKRRLDGEAEAHLIAMVCSQPPAGYKQWSLRLIRDRFVELDYVDTISHETVRSTQKNELKPWLKDRWCIPPKTNAAFVWCMEDVLAVYTRPYDPLRPLVCMDEVPKQL